MAIRILTLVAWLPLIAPLTLSANDDRYQIGAGDSISISVFNEPELSVRAQVAQSGLIRFPLLGDIRALDKSPRKLAEELEAALLDGYLVNPAVTVTIETYRPIYIKGAVKDAGRHEFLFDLNVEQAIAISGGLTDRASKDSWLILREGKEIKARGDTMVMPGDVISIGESVF
ncbi:polysaccharide biosynthesis/export family protein [Bowmanella dokdonensis]|uniref:Polysaccharide biosynthesis/export family protein n=1 Tax=Bowmanella dokdonensis TaxID=751969 RepID=A0A939INQ1_9ALTE|nr:polysaccharide biosynthesis/export family protein [Bowmanella dokdonensis]MBN7825075.1 polysaccharide biosynthesis/export family protein [Bowmanella dokdonensis]